MQEQTSPGDAAATFASVRARLREADGSLAVAEGRASSGDDRSGTALAESIAAVRLQVADLVEYVDLLEWAAAVCVIAADLRHAMQRLAVDRDRALTTFDRGAAQLAAIGAPPESRTLHDVLTRAVADANSELRAASSAGASGEQRLEDVVTRLRSTVQAAVDGASLRTRLALEQFRSCESLLGS